MESLTFKRDEEGGGSRESELRTSLQCHGVCRGALVVLNERSNVIDWAARKGTENFFLVLVFPINMKSIIVLS